MEIESGFRDGGQGTAMFDQTQADALDKLRQAKGFYVVTVADDGDISYSAAFGPGLIVPALLLDVSARAAELAIQAMAEARENEEN